MLIVLFLALGIILIVFQTTLLPFLPEVLGRPDFVFLLVAFVAYRFAWLPGIIVTFVCSWVFEVITRVFLGVYPLQCLLVFSCLKIVSANLPFKESVYQIPLVGIGYFLMHVFAYFGASLINPDAQPDWSLFTLVRETLLLVVVAIPVFMVFNRIYEYGQLRIVRPKATTKKPLRRR